jgi:hypothetical protein
MRIRRITGSAAFAAGLAALPLSTAEAQYYPHQQQPTAKGTTDQLNREELARHQPGNGYSPYYWASGSPWGWEWGYPWGVLRGGRRRRHRRDVRHRAVPGGHGGATLLLRAGILRAAVLLRVTLSPPASRCRHSGRRGKPALRRGSCSFLFSYSVPSVSRRRQQQGQPRSARRSRRLGTVNSGQRAANAGGGQANSSGAAAGSRSSLSRAAFLCWPTISARTRSCG